MKYKLIATSGSVEVYYQHLSKIEDPYWELTKEVSKYNSDHYDYTIEFHSEIALNKLCKEISVFIDKNKNDLEKFGIYRNCGIIINYIGENDDGSDAFEIEIYDYWQD